MQEEKNIQAIVNAVKERNEQLALQHGGERKALLVKIAPLTRQRDAEHSTFKNEKTIKDLTPDGLNILATLCEGKVDGITATNTAQEHDFGADTQIKRPDNVTITGGMSGKGLYPQSLATVEALKKQTTLPIIGVGGLGYDPIGKDVEAMQEAGATAFQMLSSVVQGPYGPFTVHHLKQLLSK